VEASCSKDLDLTKSLFDTMIVLERRLSIRDYSPAALE
jgi:hypothetical protein